MERLQIAWLSALAAASGCQVMNDHVIDDGIDAHLRHRHQAHTHTNPAVLDVQLKSTTGKPSGGSVSVPVRRQRLLEYAEVHPTINVIVAVLTMPTRQPHWTYTTNRALMLFGRCYWVNLAGLTVPAGNPDDRLTVCAPTNQVLDDVSLAQIMETIGQGGRP
jgi:hypothetical protein